MKRNLAVGLLLLHFSLLMIFVGGALFETFINYPNWVADIPNSLTRTREFLAVRNPGMFFQTVVPLTMVSGVIFIGFAWRSGAARNLVGASLFTLVAIELATFNLVYPRLRILLGGWAKRRPGLFRRAAPGGGQSIIRRTRLADGLHHRRHPFGAGVGEIFRARASGASQVLKRTTGSITASPRRRCDLQYRPRHGSCSSPHLDAVKHLPP